MLFYQKIHWELFLYLSLWYLQAMIDFGKTECHPFGLAEVLNGRYLKYLVAKLAGDWKSSFKTWVLKVLKRKAADDERQWLLSLPDC